VREIGIKELLEAGVHFGHQTRRWNPKMRRFIHGERNGIHIIDLTQTEPLLRRAQEFARDVAARGGTVLFVGTKKQAREPLEEAARRCGMPFVNNRWLGGLLTNWATISRRIQRLHELEEWTENGTIELLPTRERIRAQHELEKLRATLGGVRQMERLPDAVFIVDLKTEEIAVREASRLGIPIIGLVDTNADPDPIDYVIPGNDDSIRSCRLIADAIADAIAEGRERFSVLEAERAQREAEEREREERERREREEREREERERRAREEALAAGYSPDAPADAEPAEVALRELRTFEPDEEV